MAEQENTTCAHENAFEYEQSSHSGSGVYDQWAKACPDCHTHLGARPKNEEPVVIKMTM